MRPNRNKWWGWPFGAVLALILTTCSVPQEVHVEDKTHKVHIYEDSPEWDCHTMGNRRCG